MTKLQRITLTVAVEDYGTGGAEAIDIILPALERESDITVIDHDTTDLELVEKGA